MARSLRIAVALAALVGAGSLTACGSEGVTVPKSDAVLHHGAELFAQRCSGCHTLKAAGTEGSATKVKDRERVDGPNFNQRVETVPNVLFAIRNGGFSGAIMPQNVVVGSDAEAVAKFVAKYAGEDAEAPKAPTGTSEPGNAPAPAAGAQPPGS
jgi:mono/diheme cytochrome c family protein